MTSVARASVGSGLHRFCAGVDGGNSSSGCRFGASAHCTSWIEAKERTARTGSRSPQEGREAGEQPTTRGETEDSEFLDQVEDTAIWRVVDVGGGRRF